MDKMPNKAKRKIAMMKIKNAAKSAFSQNKKPKRLYKESNQFVTEKLKTTENPRLISP